MIFQGEGGGVEKFTLKTPSVHSLRAHTVALKPFIKTLVFVLEHVSAYLK